MQTCEDLVRDGHPYYTIKDTQWIPDQIRTVYMFIEYLVYMFTSYREHM